jgi:type I restriction enzyme R subunit
VKNLDECLSLHDFAHKFSSLDTYKRELKRYAELRQSAQLKYADRKDLSDYKTQLVKILDEYVDADKVEMLTGQININDKAAFDEALEDLGSHKSKAEAIAAQMQRTITEKAHTDPEFYGRFSEKIQKILAEMRVGKLADIEALKKMKEARDQLVEKKDESLPPAIIAVPGSDIFYRNLRVNFEKVGISEDAFNEIILDIFAILKKEAIIDWQRQIDTQRIMKSKIDDYLYDEVQKKRGVALDTDAIRDILDRTLALALENPEYFS